MSSQKEVPDLLAQRLNFDAVVFCGCTLKEMQVIATISLSTCILLLGFTMKLLINMFLVGVGLAFPLAVGLSWAIALILQRVKQGKPKGYLKQSLSLWLAKNGLNLSGQVIRSGKWSIGRRL